VDVGLTTVLLAIPSSVLVGTMGPYDEPKAWAMVTLVGLTVMAWVAGRVFGRAAMPSVGPDRALRAVRWILVVYGLWWGLATALSVVPGQSLWGAFGRGFGLTCFLAVLGLFFLVQAEVRTLEGACHLVDRALVGSIPVIALALGQALGWDPLPSGWDPATISIRVRSTLGQHIFLGSYLVALIPLGLARLMITRRLLDSLQATHVAVATAWAFGMVGMLGWSPQGLGAWWLSLGWSAAAAIAWSWAPSVSRAGLTSTWRLAMLGILLATQGLTLVLSTARGALVGLLTGLVAASAVLLVARGARKTLVLLGTGALVVVLFVGVLNLPASPLAGLKKFQFFERLGSMAELRERSPGWVRLRLWEGILSRWRQQLAGEEILPGLMPTFRALVGFGPETQIIMLDDFLPPGLRSLITRHGEWRAVYQFDRAHNELLDHLVTTGVIGMVLWLGVVGSIVAVGVLRLHAARGALEAGLRLGCLATVIGQAVEGLVGIASPMPRALFWIAAAILTTPFPMRSSPESVASRIPTGATVRHSRLWPSVALIAAGATFALVIVGSTYFLLGSLTYAAGTRKGVAGDPVSARHDFMRASQLVPWVPFPAEAAADVSLRLARPLSNPAQRAELLVDAQRTLDRALWYSPLRRELWRLCAHVAFGRARAGHPEEAARAFQCFSEAARLRPEDPEILIQWALALIQMGDCRTARRLAEKALGLDPKSWQAWAILARCHSALGDASQAQHSAKEARRLVPPDERDRLEKLLP
jgi:cytochrome c-type biogenesis protein CcmH/NrfG